MAEKWFPSIDAKEDAEKLTKQGAIAVLVFAASNLLWFPFAYYFRESPVDGSPVTDQLLQESLIGVLALLPILLFAAWRVYKGKGWLISALVLVWFVVEIAFKVMGGTTNVFWMIAYAGIAAMMVNGIRGCWWLRKAPSADTEASVEAST